MEIEELATAIKEKRVRLEVGNPAHIKAVKYLDRIAEEETKTKYLVTIEYSVTMVSVQEVEAHDEDEAYEIAEEEPLTIDMIEDSDIMSKEIRKI